MSDTEQQIRDRMFMRSVLDAKQGGPIAAKLTREMKETEGQLYNLQTRETKNALRSQVMKLAAMIEKEFGESDTQPLDLQSRIVGESSGLDGAPRSKEEVAEDQTVRAKAQAAMNAFLESEGADYYDQMFGLVRSVTNDRRLMGTMVPHLITAMEIYISAILNSNDLTDSANFLPLSVDSDDEKQAADYQEEVRKVLVNEYLLNTELVIKMVQQTLQDGAMYVSIMPYRNVLMDNIFKALEINKRDPSGGGISGRPGFAELMEYFREGEDRKREETMGKVYKDKNLAYGSMVGIYDGVGADSREYNILEMDFQDSGISDTPPTAEDFGHAIIGAVQDSLSPEIENAFAFSEADPFQSVYDDAFAHVVTDSSVLAYGLEDLMNDGVITDELIRTEFRNVVQDCVESFEVCTDPVKMFSAKLRENRDLQAKVAKLEASLTQDTNPAAKMFNSARSRGDATPKLPPEMLRMFEQELPGAVVRFHLAEEVIPLELNGKAYGYIVCDVTDRSLTGENLVTSNMDKLKNSVAFNQKGLGRFADNSITSSGVNGRVRSHLYGRLVNGDGLADVMHKMFGFMLANRLNFLELEGTSRYKEFVSELLGYYVNTNSHSQTAGKTRIYFIPENWMVKFGTGESLYDPAFFTARWFMMTQIKDLLVHLARGDGDRYHYIRCKGDGVTTLRPTQAAQAFRATDQARRSATTFGALTVSNLPRALGTISPGRDRYIMTTSDTDFPVTTELRERMYYTADTELQEILGDALAAELRLLPDIFRKGGQPVTATEMMQRSDSFRKTVLMLAVKFSESFTLLARKLWYFHTNVPTTIPYIVVKPGSTRETLVLLTPTEEDLAASGKKASVSKKKTAVSRLAEIQPDTIEINFKPNVGNALAGRGEKIRQVQDIGQALFEHLTPNQQIYAKQGYLLHELGEFLDEQAINNIVDIAIAKALTHKDIPGGGGAGGGGMY